MPKDQWARNQKRKPRRQRERKIKPQVSDAWARFDRVMSGSVSAGDIEEESHAFELARQQQPSNHRKPNKSTRPDPVQFVRPAYDDYPPVTTYSVYRDYDPVFYGRPPGTRHPVTDEAAAKG